jgi:site-specific recombinase XerD
MLVRDVVDLFISHRKNVMGVAPETVKAYRYALRHFTDFIEKSRSKLNYEEINRLDISCFTEYIKTELDAGHWSRSRYLMIVRVLKVFFGWIETDEECKEDGLKSWKAKMPKGGADPRREYIPSIDELRIWQKSFNTKTPTGLRDYMVFTILLETGMRRGELLSLKEEHVLFGTQTIYIPSGKTGARTIAMSPQLADLMKMYLKRKKRTHFAASPYLFPAKSNITQPTNGHYISQIFNRLKKRTGLPNITPHTLRHAFATYFLVNGGGTESLMVNTGHKTYNSLGHYLHLAKVHGQKQHEEMEKVSLLKMLKAG